MNAVQTSVYELARELSLLKVKQVKTELQGIVDQPRRRFGFDSGRAAEPRQGRRRARLRPRRAIRTEGGQDLTAVTFFLFKGKYEYQITAQAVSDQWDAIKGDLQAAVNSFTVQ